MNRRVIEDLTEEELAFLEGLWVRDGQMCPCCGRRKPTKQRASHLENDGAWIPVDEVLFVFQEIVNRVGHENAARMIPYSRVTLRKLLQQKKPYVRKSTIAKAMALLRQLREEDTVYSRDTIRFGKVARGLPPDPPANGYDYYRRHGDRDTEYKRRSRANRPTNGPA